MSKLYIVLIGPPGVGKGTQAALIQERFGAIPLASGNIFRKEIEEQTALGKEASYYIERGLLVPDSITISIIRTALKKDIFKEHGFILDGFPRTVEQATSLNEILEELQMPLTATVSLEIPEEVIVERISGRLTCPNCGAMYHKISKPPKQTGICDVCGHELIVRKDDSPEVVRERLKTFQSNTQPVIDYYDSIKNLVRVDGNLDPEQVYEEIVKKLNP